MEVIVTCENERRRDNGKTYHYKNLYHYIKSEKKTFQQLLNELSDDVPKPTKINKQRMLLVAGEVERKHPELKVWNVNTDCENEIYNEIVDSFMEF